MNIFSIVRNKGEGGLLNAYLYLFLVVGLTAGVYLLTKGNLIYSWIGLGFLQNSFLGLCGSVILIYDDLYAHNFLNKDISENSNDKIGYDEISKSSQTSLLGINWSIWCFSLMATLFFTQIIFVNQLPNLVISSYLSIIVTPCIIFLIYYQWRILKYWCPLCTFIQIILAVNAVLGFVLISSGLIDIPALDNYDIAITVILGLVLLTVTYSALSILKSSSKS